MRRWNSTAVLPRLAQYVADHEEQHLLASILSGSCPKCLIPSFRKSAATAVQLDPNNFEPRDGDHAYQSHAQFSEDKKALRNVGYHPVVLFSERYHQTDFSRFCSIYDALSSSKGHSDFDR